MNSEGASPAPSETSPESRIAPAKPALERGYSDTLLRCPESEIIDSRRGSPLPAGALSAHS